MRTKRFLIFLGLVVCLLLPGVAGQAYAQAGRLTPQQEAWLRQVYMGRTSMYDQAYINGANWTNWYYHNSNAWYSILASSNAWQVAVDWVEANSGRVDWVVSDWSNSVARAITSDNTNDWTSAALYPSIGIWGLKPGSILKVLEEIETPVAGYWELNSAGQVTLGSVLHNDAWWTTNAGGQIVLRTL